LCELGDKATQAAKALTLDVMKNNRARSLYERLGFGVIGESKYKLKMRGQENAAASAKQVGRAGSAPSTSRYFQIEG
jgi:ribosomal protein S18 acetylase RimI-like enzyme